MRAVIDAEEATGMKRNRMLERAAQSLREGRLEGIIDEPKSGRWNNWVYYMRGKTQCCRRYVRPRDRRTPAQLRCRAALTAASKEWSHSRTLTEEERQACRIAGAKVKTRRRLGQGGTLTGQLYFVGKECAGRQNAEGRGQNSRAKGERVEGRGQSEEGRMTGEDRGAREMRRLPAQTQGKAGIRGFGEAGRGGGLCGRGRRMSTGSTWDEYRGATVALPCQYRWDKGRGMGKAEYGMRSGRGARGRWNGHWRELWRGG